MVDRGGQCASPPRLLLVDDDDAFSQTISALLTADGHFQVVGRARNGIEAIDLAQRLHHAILMDIEMPIMDGVEATRRILEFLPLARIVAVSGFDYSERALEARLAGAYDYVRKGRVEADIVEALLTATRTRPPSS